MSFLTREDALLDPTPEADPELGNEIDGTLARSKPSVGTAGGDDPFPKQGRVRKRSVAAQFQLPRGKKYNGERISRSELDEVDQDPGDQSSSSDGSAIDEVSEKDSDRQGDETSGSDSDESSGTDNSEEDEKRLAVTTEADHGMEEEYAAPNLVGMDEESPDSSDQAELITKAKAQKPSDLETRRAKVQRTVEHRPQTARASELAEMERLRSEKKEELEVAKVISEQKALYDSILGSRISLQQVLSSANRLPSSLDETEKFAVREQLERTKRSLLHLTSTFESLQSDLVPSQFQKMENRDDSVNSIWKITDNHWRLSRDWRNRTLAEWSERASEANGVVADNATFKSLNQNVTAQIEKVLEDRERLIRRTRLKRVPVHFLSDSKDNSNEYDTDIYDDGDFYHQLLREVVEQGSVDGTKQTLQIRKMRQSNRKSVDRKASKGRKLRYHVHEKLVGFIAPKPSEPPLALDELVSGLFKST